MGTNTLEGDWEHFSHDADIGIRGRGPTKAAAFEQSARALTAVIADLDTVHPHDTIEIHCEAPDDEILLVDWLNGLIYEMAVQKMLFSEFDVTIKDHHLDAVVRGEEIDRDRHAPAVEIKGATYTDLEVRENDSDNTWIAQCVVDV